MATLSLKISLENGSVTKMMQFDPSTTVYDACRIIREKVLEASNTDPKEYGLFLTSDEDSKKGVWLEPARALDYYILRNGDLLHYSRKMRNLRVRMLDGTVKTLLVDDSQVVANLMVVICTKIGITNYDEYGLVREDQKEEPDPADKPNFGTLTLRRRNQDKDRDAKMDQLRKKLRTDDEVNWVEPSKTLREQGVDVTETLLLRRKLFFSDRNVDSRDPVQLNLLYVQARDAVLDGTHPVTQEKACEFAGIQCQIQFGDHKEDKHTPGFLDLKEFLPASYAKVKGIEKKVFKEHRLRTGLSELDAKVLYTKSARALRTYGVAFFLVKEKMKGKNKLVPRLLGVTKDSVLRLDEKTKEIIQTWPLTTVRRWCASPNTFTLDFGDYSDQYYSVQTTEAEQILQVIAGYIDIILRKQQAKDHLGLEGDEGSAMLEDTVAPHRANIIQHDTFKSGKVNTESVAKPAVLRPGPEGAKPFAVGHTYSAQQTTISGQVVTTHAPPAECQSQPMRAAALGGAPQRALLGTIESGRELIRRTEAELTRTTIEDIGGDAASVRWKAQALETRRAAVTGHIAAMNAATAQVVTLTSGPSEEVDHTAVGAAITTITSNLPEVTRGVAAMAALMEEPSGDKLLDATRRLCSAFSDLLTAAEPETKEPRQSLLNAASRVGEASTSVLHTIAEEPPSQAQDILLSSAKTVANSTAALVLKAKTAAAQCRHDQPLQNTVIAAATHCALAASQLVACAKVVAPTLQNPQCREQLAAAARQVARAVEALLAACEPARPAPDLAHAAREVTQTLERLLAICENENTGQATETQTAVETVLTATERVVTAGDSAELVRQARALGHATARLVHDIKTEAERQPSDAQRKLLAAAKLLADATARMVEAARQCASAPQDSGAQESLRRAAEELRYITVDYAQGTDVAGAQFTRLQESARQATASATQLSVAAASAAPHNSSSQSQMALEEECAGAADQAPRLLGAAHDAAARPQAAAAKLHLINAAESFLQSGSHLSSAARSALPTVADGAAAKQLAESAQRFTTHCAELRAAVSGARVSCRGLELPAAGELARELRRELEGAREGARAGELRPLPGETEEWAMQSMHTSSRATSSAAAQLAACGRAGDAAGAARGAAALAEGLRYWTATVRATAALTQDPMARDTIITTGSEVLTSSITLVETVERYFSSSEAVDADQLRQHASDVTRGLERTLAAVPTHAELARAAEDVQATLDILQREDFPRTERSYGELQASLNTAAVGLHDAAASLAAAGPSRGALAAAGGGFGQAFNSLLGVAAEMAGQTEDRETLSQMVSSMKTVTTSSSHLLSAAKNASQDLTRPHARQTLAEAARAVTDAINHLVDVCTEGAPGQKECAAAIRSIESTRPLLAHPAEPVADLGYFACRDSVVDHSKKLSEAMSGLAGSIKKSEYAEFARHVGGVARAVTGLVEGAAQAAYLVAVSAPSSVAGRAGLIERGRLARAADAITQATHTLRDTPQQRAQVLSAATAIAKHTSALCNACRDASARTPQPHDKRHFVQAAKEVANSTAALVKEIKALDNDYSEENRSRCALATRPLDEAVRSLVQFADSPEFAALPARISAEGRRSQEGILECGDNIISGSCAMLSSARALLAAPGERGQWAALATTCQALSDSIKGLVKNIGDKSPGRAECSAARQSLSALSQRLDQAALAAVAQELPPHHANTLDGYMEQIESSTTEILERLEPLRHAAKFEAENLGHAVTQAMSYCEPLVSASVGAASHMTDSSLQSALLTRVRTVLEALVLLAQAAQDAHGNPRATELHGAVDGHAGGARAALTELIAARREVGAARGAVRPLLEAVARARDRLQDHRMSLVGPLDEFHSYADYQTRMLTNARELARLATDMSAKAGEGAKLLQLGGELCDRYSQLCGDSAGAAAAAPSADHGNSLRTAVLDLGEAVSALIQSGGHCRLAASSENQRQLADCAAAVNEKVVVCVGALQAAARGTQACLEAAAAIAAIVGDLDTTILFATAGTLQSDKEGDSFSNHRESILQTAKRLVEDTKALVGGAAGNQAELAAAAAGAARTIVQLCDVVKQGAATLGCSNPDPQVFLLNAARDVAQALRDLCIATKGASGKPVTHPAMEQLKQSAKVMVTNVTSLLKTVKVVEDEQTRGTRALEAAIEGISQEIVVLTNGTPPGTLSTAEALVQQTRQLTEATSRAVAAGSSPDQQLLITAANQGRRAVQELLHACKGAAYSAETGELRATTLSAGREAALAYRALLEGVLGGAGAGELLGRSRRVAAAAGALLAAAHDIKGSDMVDPADPAVIAETELLGAAASIDAAARKLAALRPRTTVPVQEADESLNFDEMILEAARGIISATSALVRAASAAQRELVDQGKMSRRPAVSSADGQWSEGLVSAARLVAAAAHALVEAAHALTQGAGSEERLIASAKHVASTTAQLLVACKVKADPASEATARLQAAGAAVIRSTDGLVRAAREAISREEERSLVLDRGMVGGMAAEIDARTDVLRIEKELEEARGRLKAIRVATKLRSGNEESGPEDDVVYRLRTPTSSFVNTTYSPNSTASQHTLERTNLSSTVSQLNQSLYGPPGSPSYLRTQSPGGYNQTKTGYDQTKTGYDQTKTGYDQTKAGYDQNQSYSQTEVRTSEQNGQTHSPTFSSFRPQEEPKNYEGFTTRNQKCQKSSNDRTMADQSEMEVESTVVVRSMRLPEVRRAELVEGGASELSAVSELSAASGVAGRGGLGGRRAPPPPPRRAGPRKYELPEHYETRLYDTPQAESRTEESYQSVNQSSFNQSSFSQSNQFKQDQRYDAPKLSSPLSPKFNARNLKLQNTEPLYSTLNKKPFDGVGQTFSERQSSTEAIPGGTKRSEYSVQSESYQSYPRTEFVTSTPTKTEFSNFKSADLVKAPTPDFDRVASPYGKDTRGYTTPNFMEETTTEVKEVPNGTQKITTTKIYSSSPVNMTSTSTKYEPVRLDGIDELAKSFDSDSKYSTLDSKFNTMDSKMSSETSRSFKPVEFATSSKVKDLSKELESSNKKLTKQTITSETIERKSVMTSSHKSETSSTVTKKFGNF